MPSVLVPIADGSEDLEAAAIIDILRRAGIEVTVAGLHEGPIVMSRGMRIVPDATLDEAMAGSYDMIALPGGMPGVEHLEQDARIQALLARMAESGRYTGAICAAPRILARAGLLEGKRATGYPGFIDDGTFPGLTCTGAAVEVDGNIVTSRGPGTAIDFALAIVTLLCGAETRESVETGLVRAP